MTTTSFDTINSSTIQEEMRPEFLDLDEALNELQALVQGQVLFPGSRGYDESRKIRSLHFDRRPAVIVVATNAGDVATAVRFAREQDLKLSVRSGGHSFSGHSVNDDGLVIDLREMQGVAIDPATLTARAQPGATSAILGAAAQEYGLAISTGDTSSVALGGLTLGGGIGWMARQQGLTIDNLLSVEIVTAEGEIVRASETEHSDLFWALRGGGGNFGIVTEFELQLHEVGQILGGVVALPATNEAIRRYADWAVSAPETITTITFFMPAPPAPFVPENVVGKPAFVVMFCVTGELSEAERTVAPLRNLATPLFEMVAPMPYTAIYAFTDDATHPALETARSIFLDSMPDEVIEAMIESAKEATPTSMIQVRTLGGAMARVPVDATAFAHREQPYQITIISQWPEGDGKFEKAWVEHLYGQVRSFGHGVYVNFLVNEPERIAEAYPEATYRRLAAVKQRYDPENLFSGNENIRPACE